MDRVIWPHPGIAMKHSIDLSPEQRNALLDRYRKDHDSEVRFRSHILLLLDDGHSSQSELSTVKSENSISDDGYVACRAPIPNVVDNRLAPPVTTSPDSSPDISPIDAFQVGVVFFAGKIPI